MLKNILYYTNDQLISQKAKGVRFLADKQLVYTKNVRQTVIAKDAADLVAALDHQTKHGEQYWFRPCPATPQHGFVDSRTLASDVEAQKLIDEILATGEKVEILIQPKIEGAWSGIINSNGVSLGPGIDGATGGQAFRFNAPVDLTSLQMTKAQALQVAGDEEYYLEVVSQWGTPFQLVQLRGGLPVPLIQDFVPEDMVVKHVETASGSLLDWQKRCEELKKINGAIVDLAGGAPSSHYWMHAKANGIPVVCTLKPYIGQHLIKITTPKPSQKCYNRLAQCLAMVFRHSSIDLNHIGPAMAVAHSCGTWYELNEGHAKLLAWACGILIRSTAALGLGEARHWNACGPGCHSKVAPPQGLVVPSKKPSRDSIYQAAKKFAVKKQARLLPVLVGAFLKNGWSGSYGGPKWGAGMVAATNLMKSCCLFMQAPQESHYKQMLLHLNELANAVHNGGRMHNKIISESVLDRISTSPGLFLVDSVLAECLFSTRVYDESQLKNKMSPAILGKRLYAEVKAGEEYMSSLNWTLQAPATITPKKPKVQAPPKPQPKVQAPPKPLLPQPQGTHWLQAKFVTDGVIHVQGGHDTTAPSFAVKRSYGWTANFSVAEALTADMNALPPDVASAASPKNAFYHSLLFSSNNNMIKLAKPMTSTAYWYGYSEHISQPDSEDGSSVEAPPQNIAPLPASGPTSFWDMIDGEAGSPFNSLKKESFKHLVSCKIQASKHTVPSDGAHPILFEDSITGSCYSGDFKPYTGPCADGSPYPMVYDKKLYATLGVTDNMQVFYIYGANSNKLLGWAKMHALKLADVDHASYDGANQTNGKCVYLGGNTFAESPGVCVVNKNASDLLPFKKSALMDGWTPAYCKTIVDLEFLSLVAHAKASATWPASTFFDLLGTDMPEPVYNVDGTKIVKISVSCCKATYNLTLKEGK